MDATRVSIPVHVPFVLSNNEWTGATAVLALDPGLLCEDQSADVSEFRCGYRLGATLNYTYKRGSRGHVDVHHERVSGNARYLLSFGNARSIGGSRRDVEVGFALGQAVSTISRITGPWSTCEG